MGLHAGDALHPGAGAHAERAQPVQRPEDATERARFYKPTTRDRRNGLATDRREEFEAQWADEIADYLAQVHATAAGGTLVLGRSYADLEAWRVRLERDSGPT